jgi:hypothetical protein
VLVNQILGRIAASSGNTSAVCRHMFFSVSEIAIFWQSACQKWQSFVVVRNDKALSASLSFGEKNLRRSILWIYVPCREKQQAYACLSLSFSCGILLHKKEVD